MRCQGRVRVMGREAAHQDGCHQDNMSHQSSKFLTEMRGGVLGPGGGRGGARGQGARPESGIWS